MGSQTSEGRQVQRRGELQVLQAVTGSISAGITGDAIRTGWASYAEVVITVTANTRPEANEELDFYLQSSPDGTNWHDLENFHTETAGAQKRRMEVAGPFASNASTAFVEAAIADNTKLDAGLGMFLRLKSVSTDPGVTAPAFNYSATVFLQA